MTTEDRIRERLAWAADDLRSFGQNVIDTVAAVMAVHASVRHGERLVCGFCIGSDEEHEPYPCETVRVIAETLGSAP